MDALSDVLQTIRLASNLFCRSELSAPWGVHLRGGGLAGFHYVARGSCWLTVEEASAPAAALSGGDLVLLPLGHAHTLRDTAHSPVRSIEVLVSEARGDDGIVRSGGGGSTTTLISGCFSFEDRSKNPLLASLPPLIRITSDEGRAVPWLEQNLQFIAAESASPRPGSHVVLTRIADVVFVQALRAFIERLPYDSGGFLRALREPHIAQALGLMHRQLDHPWTVETLASKCGLSRSAFAERFKQCVGEPPLGYLTRRRMERATELLRTGSTLADVARRTGYSSEAAFSHAFRQWAGTPPGAYRKAQRDERARLGSSRTSAVASGSREA
ncbi:AraC family transcriptional regulator [Sorangium cellulosum]|uniref:AraC family transcriptional regulator n=1 Tax=Sorangium cellulosum TaxID=56 RepID=A0A2L0EMY0_SORCE|nr:AraC family transcriptional regulator [Sorangium cellulosum]AUX40635.1 AraC family transcriptional regulator [Sorangium cellulosum]